MTATDILRRLLDERGVEWWQSANTLGCVFTRWYSPLFGDEVVAMENGEEGLVVFDHYLTPEQAVAATLGPGTCRDVRSEDATIAFECSECGCWVAYDEYWETGIYIQGEGQQAHIHPHYCPNCGKRVVG